MSTYDLNRSLAAVVHGISLEIGLKKRDNVIKEQLQRHWVYLGIPEFTDRRPHVPDVRGVESLQRH